MIPAATLLPYQTRARNSASNSTVGGAPTRPASFRHGRRHLDDQWNESSDATRYVGAGETGAGRAERFHPGGGTVRTRLYLLGKLVIAACAALDRPSVALTRPTDTDARSPEGDQTALVDLGLAQRPSCLRSFPPLSSAYAGTPRFQLRRCRSVAPSSAMAFRCAAVP